MTCPRSQAGGSKGMCAKNAVWGVEKDMVWLVGKELWDSGGSYWTRGWYWIVPESRYPIWSGEFGSQGFALNLSVRRGRVPQVPPTTVSVARSKRMGQRVCIRGREVEEGGTTGTASAYSILHCKSRLSPYPENIIIRKLCVLSYIN